MAETSIDSDDPRLRGRTYAITFDRVWNASLELAGGGLSRWSLRWWDDEAGAIQASAKTLVFRLIDDVIIKIRLDEDGQTRVDLSSSSRTGNRGDLGVNGRRIKKFCRALDKKLGAKPHHILDPTKRNALRGGSYPIMT